VQPDPNLQGFLDALGTLTSFGDGCPNLHFSLVQPDPNLQGFDIFSKERKKFSKKYLS